MYVCTYVCLCLCLSVCLSVRVHAQACTQVEGGVQALLIHHPGWEQVTYLASLLLARSCLLQLALGVGQGGGCFSGLPGWLGPTCFHPTPCPTGSPRPKNLWQKNQASAAPYGGPEGGLLHTDTWTLSANRCF